MDEYVLTHSFVSLVIDGFVVVFERIWNLLCRVYIMRVNALGCFDRFLWLRLKVKSPRDVYDYVTFFLSCSSWNCSTVKIPESETFLKLCCIGFTGNS